MSRGTALLAGALGIVLALTQPIAEASPPVLKGKVLSGKLPLAQVPVTLYRTASGRPPVALGTSVTRGDGSFRIVYPSGRSDAVLYLTAGRRLASVLGKGLAPRTIIVNERTTVAAGFALAQFVSGRAIAGKAPGLQNAAGMARNLVNSRTGTIGSVLARAPNGSQTSTLRAFNSLANMLAGCVRSKRRAARRSHRRAATASTASSATPVSRSIPRAMSGCATAGRQSRSRRIPAATRSSHSSGWPDRSGRR